MVTKQYGLDDLPRFSSWPACLLGLEPVSIKKKTPDQIAREFEEDKWGPLLEWARSRRQSVCVEEANAHFLRGKPDRLCYKDGSYSLLSRRKAHAQYLDLAAEVLTRYMPASTLVELGAGFGNIILNLTKRKSFDGIQLVAGEYTQSGIELIRLLGKTLENSITVGHCDLSQSKIADLDIKENALIYTSYACHYVPRFSPSFVDAFRKLRPRTIVHIEPCYEHCNGNSLLDLMRRRYIEVNDYNTNLVTILREQQALGRIHLLEERPSVFGLHPLLIVSVLAWTFAD